MGPWRSGEPLANAKLCRPWAESRLVQITREGIGQQFADRHFLGGSGIDSSAEEANTSHLILHLFDPSMNLLAISPPPFIFVTTSQCAIVKLLILSSLNFTKKSPTPLLYSALTPIPLPHSVSTHKCASPLSRDALWITPLCIFQLCCPLNSSHHFTMHLHTMHLPTLYTFTMHLITKWKGWSSHYALPTLYPPTRHKHILTLHPKQVDRLTMHLPAMHLLTMHLPTMHLLTVHLLTMHLPAMHLGRTQVCNMHILVCSERHQADKLNTNLKELEIVRAKSS